MPIKSESVPKNKQIRSFFIASINSVALLWFRPSEATYFATFSGVIRSPERSKVLSSSGSSRQNTSLLVLLRLFFCLYGNVRDWVSGLNNAFT
jgi:hypothetical protein